MVFFQNCFSKPHLKVALLFVLMLLSNLQVFGQQIQQHNGDYTINENINGYALFDYYKSGQETVKHGNFRFERMVTDSVENTVDGIVLTGIYQNNRKDGPWRYSYKEFSPVGKPGTTDNEIIFRTNGHDYTISANFSSGKINGDFSIKQRTVANSSTKDTLLYLSSNYAVGTMIGVVTGKDEKASFRGRLNREGMPDGVWEFTHKDQERIKEYREYSDGVLKNHYFTINNNQLDITHIGLDTTEDQSGEIWEKVRIDPQYLRVIYYASIGVKEAERLQKFIDPALDYIQQSNDLLEKTLFRANVHNEIEVWNLTEGNTGPIEPVSARLRKFPINDSEKSTYDEASKLLTKIQETINRFFDNPQISIGIHSYREIYFNHEVMRVFSEKVDLISPLVELLYDDAAVYLDRKAMIKYIIPDINYPSEITYAYNDTNYSENYNFPKSINSDSASVRDIHSHLEEIEKRIQEITDNTEEILKQYRSETELQEKEADLLKTKDSIIALFSNKNKKETYNEWHREIAQEVIPFVEDTFINYAALPIENRVAEVDRIETCFTESKNLYKSLEDLPRKLNRLDEVYTRTVWNPYTFTYMDERVKERVYRTFENDLFPYVWSELKNNLSCTTIADKTQNLETLYRKMITTREEDTRDMERQLRRARNIDDIINAMNLNFR